MSPYEISKILVAVDLSEGSLNALQTAISKAKENHASMDILWVADSSYSVYSKAETRKAIIEKSRYALMALIHSVEKTHGILPGLVIEEGNVTDTINRVAHEGMYDLIVIGKYGESGYRDKLIGSTARNLIKKASRPVLCTT